MVIFTKNTIDTLTQKTKYFFIFVFNSFQYASKQKESNKLMNEQAGNSESDDEGDETTSRKTNGLEAPTANNNKHDDDYFTFQEKTKVIFFCKVIEQCYK